MDIEVLDTYEAPMSVDGASGLLAGIGIGLGILGLMGC